MVAFAPREAVAGGADPAVGGDLTGTASTAQIAAGAVGTAELAAGGVTTAKLADGSVTTVKLGAAAVTDAKIASGVTPAKLVPGTNLQVLRTVGGVAAWSDSIDAAVGGDLSGTISNAQIVAGAVGTAELAALGVTDAKIASGITASKVTAAADGTVLTSVGGVAAWLAPAADVADTRINVKKSPYLAKGDAQTKRGTATIANASNALAVTGATFVSGDVGKTMIVAGAGPAGARLVTTIATRVDATHVTLATTASTAVTNGHVAWGTDDTAAVQAALNAIPGTAAVGGPSISGGQVDFPPGKYLLTAGLSYTGSAGLKMTGLGGYGFTNKNGGESEGGARLVTAGVDILTIHDTSPAPQIHSLGFQDISVTTNGTGANGTATGIRSLGASYGIVTGCDFSAMGVGVLIDGSDGADSSWWKISDNIFYSCGKGIYNISQDYNNVDGGGSMELRGNVHICYGTQIAVHVRDAVNYVKSFGGKADLHDGTSVGIQFDAGKSALVSGFTVEHHDGGEIAINVTGRGLIGSIDIIALEAGGGGGGSTGAGIVVSGHARQMTDVVTTNGSAVITSATAAFEPRDDGLTITGAGVPANTKILSVQSATQATMNKNATATSAAATVVISNVTRNVSVLGGHVSNFPAGIAYGTNTASCYADGLGIYNYGAGAVTFAAATAIAAAASFHYLPKISINGSAARSAVVTDLGVGNHVELVQSDSKLELLPTTAGTPATTASSPGRQVVGAASLWFEGNDGAMHELTPSGAAGAGFFSGTGTPNSVVAAPVGSLYTQTDAQTVGEGLYPWLKVSGSGTTGWEQLISVDGNDHEMRLQTTGAPSGTNQLGNFMRITPAQMTLKRMKVTLKTAANGAMVVQLRKSTDNGSSWADVTGFTVTYANGAQVRTVDPANVNVNEGDILGYSITTPSGADMEITLVGNYR